MKTPRSVASLVVAALLTGTAGRAAAQFAAPPHLAAEDAASAFVALEVEAPGLALDEGAVRDAILRELELDQRAAPAGAAKMAILLRVVADGELTVTIQAGEGRDLSRSVAAPARADEVPELTALLVGNLARNEASDLLARLRLPEPEPTLPTPPSAVAAPAEPILPLDSVNLSLVYPLTLRERAAERRFALELGLFYGRIGALSGIGLSLGGVTYVKGSVDGVMLGGIGYWHGGAAEGVRLAGVLGVGGSGLDGVSIAGVTTIERGDVSGVQLSGAVNVATGDLDGVQATGVLNTAANVEGAQLSGAVNIATGDVDGVQATSVLNRATDVEGGQLAAGANFARSVDGVQLSAVMNHARGDLDGVQVSSGLNLAERINGMQISIVNVGGDVDGAQIGFVNVARDVNGAQIGLVNVAREVDGVSLAYVPYSERGRTQAVVWFSASMPTNLGVRFHTGALYVMPTLGYDPRGDEVLLDPIDGDFSTGVSLGYRLNIQRAFADLDVNYSNRSNGNDYQENDIDLRYRLLGGFQVTRAFGVFAGGGLRHHFRTQAPSDQFVRPELSVGIQVL